MPQKTKTLLTRIDEYQRTNPTCPNCNTNVSVVRAGIRKMKTTQNQLYLCKQCNKRFAKRAISGVSYSPKIILIALTYFNSGHTLGQTAKHVQRRFKIKIPISTIKSWKDKYASDLSFSKLRKRFKLDPKELIKTRKFYHPQLYQFKVHTLKLNIAAKSYPALKDFINETLDKQNDHLFQAKDTLRCSEIAHDLNISKPSIRQINNSPACRMTNFALELAKTKTERHEKVEEFFLINDSATIAIEVPVYLFQNEYENIYRPSSPSTSTTTTITGHIDILQARGNKIHIMDYKPEAMNEKHAYKQLILYAQALSKRTNLNLSDMVCAYFDDKNYFQFIIE